MKLKVEGHSGCRIEVVETPEMLTVVKSADAAYSPRLLRQAQKQREAASRLYQHIRVPKILNIEEIPGENGLEAALVMEYVYSKNFIEYFEHAGAEQIEYLISALIRFLEEEIEASPLARVPKEVLTSKFEDVRKNCRKNPHLANDEEIEEILCKSGKIFDEMGDLELPLGRCHGDLTFSNILFNGNNYYLIDFLDSFIESPLLDIVKLRQDTAWRWSQLMYHGPYDALRLKIVCDKIDRELHTWFEGRYGWYRNLYAPLQLMNFLRILQYAHDPGVIGYLKETLREL